MTLTEIRLRAIMLKQFSSNSAVGPLADDIELLCEEVKLLREALSFYAYGRNNWFRSFERENFDIIEKSDVTSKGEGVRAGGHRARTDLSESLKRIPE